MENDSNLSLDGLFGDIDLAAILPLVSALGGSGESDYVALIHALKPHLSEERRTKADQVIKILKLIDLMPAVKESGLLDNIL
jgi:hypothetical protein